MRPQWTYGLGLIPLASLLIGVMPSHAAQQSGGQPSDMQAQEAPSQSRPHEGQNWQTVSGTIKKMKKVDSENMDQQNLVVQVQTDQGRRQTIDLGDADNLEDFDIQKGDRITAWGKTMNMGDRQVLMARKLKVDGEKITLDRPEISQPSRQQARRQEHELTQQGGGGERQPYKRIKGEVIGAGEVVAFDRKGNVMEYDRDAFYIVAEPDGRQAHLLVAEQMDPWLNVGEPIEATVGPDGSVIAISRLSGGSPEQPEMQQSARSPSGSREEKQGNRQDRVSRQQQPGQEREQDRFSRQQQSGHDREQDRFSRQQQAGHEREQTARQSPEEHH